MHFPRILFVLSNCILLVVTSTIRDRNELTLNNRAEAYDSSTPTDTTAYEICSSDGLLADGTPCNPSESTDVSYNYPVPPTVGNEDGSSYTENNGYLDSNDGSSTVYNNLEESPMFLAQSATGLTPFVEWVIGGILSFAGALGLLYTSDQGFVNKNAETEKYLPEVKAKSMSLQAAGQVLCPGVLFGESNNLICDGGKKSACVTERGYWVVRRTAECTYIPRLLWSKSIISCPTSIWHFN